MQTIRLFLLVVSACLVTVHSVQAAPFVSPNGYSITPAPGWTAKRGSIQKMDVILMPQPATSASPYLYVVVAPAKPRETLEQARAQAVSFYAHMSPKIKLVNTGYETVGNVRALRFMETYSLGGRRMSLRQETVIKNGKVYAFTCFTPFGQKARYAPAFTQMLHSVRWSH